MQQEGSSHWIAAVDLQAMRRAAVALRLPDINSTVSIPLIVVNLSSGIFAATNTYSRVACRVCWDNKDADRF